MLRVGRHCGAGEADNRGDRLDGRLYERSPPKCDYATEPGHHLR